MPITIHPKPGQILMCDFSQGFKEPEMIKNRPVVVLTPYMAGREKLVTIAALSTVKPNPIRNYHLQIPKHSLPQIGFFQKDDTWLKGDMVYSVGFHRLNLIRLEKRDELGNRTYFKQRLGREQMQQVYECVLHGLSLSHLSAHL